MRHGTLRPSLIRVFSGVLLFGPVFATLLLMPGLARAFKQADLERVKALYHCPGCDLSDADLTGVNLAYANLSGANLSGANLAGVQLSQSNLTGADLSGADLTGAKLYMALLSGANFTNARLTEARLYNAVLGKANLSGADLSGALWIDGKKCGLGSVGKCVPEKKNEDGSPPSSPKMQQGR